MIRLLRAGLQSGHASSGMLRRREVTLHVATRGLQSRLLHPSNDREALLDALGDLVDQEAEDAEKQNRGHQCQTLTLLIVDVQRAK